MKKLFIIASIAFAFSLILESCSPYSGLQSPYKHPRKPKPMASVQQPLPAGDRA